MTRITAAEAHEIAKKPSAEVQAALDEVYNLIRTAAHKSERKLELRTGLWGSNGYRKTPWLWDQAARILREDGYLVVFCTPNQGRLPNDDGTSRAYTSVEW
jgi:hypothetical protein